MCCGRHQMTPTRHSLQAQGQRLRDVARIPRAADRFPWEFAQDAKTRGVNSTESYRDPPSIFNDSLFMENDMTDVADDSSPRDSTVFGRCFPGVLNNGDVLSQEEFHSRHEQTPEGCKAELVNGTVFITGPVSFARGRAVSLLACLFGIYQSRTKGVQGLLNVTIILGPRDEPQPDIALRISPCCGGQSHNESINDVEYVGGAPELVLEVAYSSRAIELFHKLSAYRNGGVLEYIVYCVEEKELRGFNLTDERVLPLDTAGVVKLQAFPGLWINAAAVCQLDFAAAIKTLEAGLASPEHAEFVATLEAQRQRIAAEQAKASS